MRCAGASIARLSLVVRLLSSNTFRLSVMPHICESQLNPCQHLPSCLSLVSANTDQAVWRSSKEPHEYAGGMAYLWVSTASGPIDCQAGFGIADKVVGQLSLPNAVSVQLIQQVRSRTALAFTVSMAAFAGYAMLNIGCADALSLWYSTMLQILEHMPESRICSSGEPVPSPVLINHVPPERLLARACSALFATLRSSFHCCKDLILLLLSIWPKAACKAQSTMRFASTT